MAVRLRSVRGTRYIKYAKRKNHETEAREHSRASAKLYFVHVDSLKRIRDDVRPSDVDLRDFTIYSRRLRLSSVDAHAERVSISVFSLVQARKVGARRADLFPSCLPS